MTTFLSNRSIYESVICGIVPAAREQLWIATADIKDMYVETGGRDMVPFLAVLADMVKRGIEVRLIHAKEPGRPPEVRWGKMTEGMLRLLDFRTLRR